MDFDCWCRAVSTISGLVLVLDALDDLKTNIPRSVALHEGIVP